jgi:hypothetical protein
MGTLDYQKPQDAGREVRTSWRRKIFGITRANIWAALAREIGARHVKGGWWKGDRVVARVGPWLITLDTYSEGGEGATDYTRLRAPFVSLDGFRVYRKRIFSGLGKFFGMQDIEIGDAYFDDAFIIQSNKPAQVRRLLLNGAAMRRLLTRQGNVMFQAKDDEGWFSSVAFPPNVDELSLTVPRIIKDVDVLKGMFELFDETLHQLVAIGSAADSPPGVRL